MSDHLALIISALLMIWLIQRLKLVALGASVMTMARKANAIANDHGLTDLEKEQQTQQAAKALMAMFLQMLFKGALAVALPMLALVALATMGWLDLDNIYQLAGSVPYIAGFTLLFVLAWFGSKRG